MEHTAQSAKDGAASHPTGDDIANHPNDANLSVSISYLVAMSPIGQLKLRLRVLPIKAAQCIDFKFNFMSLFLMQERKKPWYWCFI